MRNRYRHRLRKKILSNRLYFFFNVRVLMSITNLKHAI